MILLKMAAVVNLGFPNGQLPNGLVVEMTAILGSSQSRFWLAWNYTNPS